MRTAALDGNLVNQIQYQVDPDLVSSDIIGTTCCSFLIVMQQYALRKWIRCCFIHVVR